MNLKSVILWFWDWFVHDLGQRLTLRDDLIYPLYYWIKSKREKLLNFPSSKLFKI